MRQKVQSASVNSNTQGTKNYVRIKELRIIVRILLRSQANAHATKKFVQISECSNYRVFELTGVHRSNIICHSIRMGAGLAVFKSDWSRASLRVSPYKDQLLSSSSLTDTNALRNTRRKAEAHQEQYFTKMWIRIFRKFSEMLGKNFGKFSDQSKSSENRWKRFQFIF